MELISGTSHSPSAFRMPVRSVVTIGNFDGVHLGHQKIIQQAIEQAKRTQAQSVVYTFKPHPQEILRPDVPLHFLTTYQERAQRIEALGVDYLVEEAFDLKFSQLEPREFFSDILCKRLNAKAIVVGFNFRFGKGRHGHLDFLGELCKEAGVNLTIIPPHPVKIGDSTETVSSSKIREALLKGEVDRASAFLGSPFVYQGTVVHGESRGNKIGFPTANIELPRTDKKLVLSYGVYVTQTHVNGKQYPSVTNIGMRPTFNAKKNLTGLVETHLLDTQMDLYGQTIEVGFLKYLRPEKKFSSIEELKAQIQKDIQQAKRLIFQSVTSG